MHASEGIQDLGLGADEYGRLTILANPEFWAKIPVESPLAEQLFKHEVLHLLLGHHTRRFEFSNSRLFFLAADLVVNQYTGTESGDEKEITLSRFPDLNLAPNREVDYYYERLNRAWETLLNRAKLLGEAAVLSPYWSWFLMDSPAMARHRFWPGPEKSRTVGLSVWARLGQIHSTIQYPAPAALPFAVRMLLESGNQSFSTGINWRNILRKFATTARSTRLRDTLHRSSKRYGRPPGLKLRRKSRLIIGVDVSGSISQALVQVFFQEIRRIWRLGAEVEIVEFDSTIQNKYAFKGMIPALVTGRGDTDFNPPIAAANREKTADGLILLTDGLGPEPAVFPVMPALWVIAGRKTQEVAVSKFPGRVINVNIP